MDGQGDKSARGPSIVALRYLATILTAAAFVGGAGWLLQRKAKRRKAKSEGDADGGDSDESSED